MTVTAIAEPDGLVEAMAALRRAQRALAALDTAKDELCKAFGDVADAGARSACRDRVATWEEIGELAVAAVPFLPALEIGEYAYWLAKDKEGDYVDSDISRLEAMIVAALEASGPTDRYRDRVLNARELAA